MERDTEGLPQDTQDLLPEVDNLDDATTLVDAGESGEDEAQLPKLAASGAHQRNLDARRRIEQLREAQWLKNEIDDWE